MQMSGLSGQMQGESPASTIHQQRRRRRRRRNFSHQFDGDNFWFLIQFAAIQRRHQYRSTSWWDSELIPICMYRQPASHPHPSTLYPFSGYSIWMNAPATINIDDKNFANRNIERIKIIVVILKLTLSAERRRRAKTMPVNSSSRRMLRGLRLL